MGRISTDESGFSLIEMLIVIVILSILMAIMIPVFFNQRERGWESQSVSALTNGQIAMEAAYVRASGSYNEATVEELIEVEGLKYADTITLTIESANENGFCLSAEHEDWGQTLFWDSEIGEARPTDCSGEY